MKRIFLIHWNAGEAEERAGKLRKLGYTVEPYSEKNTDRAKELRDNPPDLIVIDLERIPSQGRAIGTHLRQQKATRNVPIIFVGGEEQNVDQTKKLLPDATYTDWRSIRGALKNASSPAKPVVPDTMAGYSGTPLPKKLGIKPGSIVALLGAPENFEKTLGPLPAGVRLTTRSIPKPNVAILFVKSVSDLEKRFPKTSNDVADRGALWIAWPKKASGIQSDLGEPVVRAFGLARAWVDYKICAIDATWSGLCFARRAVEKR